jgi:hypothetical protein
MIVGPHQVVGMVGLAGEHLADEAWSFAGASLVGCGQHDRHPLPAHDRGNAGPGGRGDRRAAGGGAGRHAPGVPQARIRGGGGVLRPGTTRRLTCVCVVMELRGFEPLTPCMPMQFRLPPPSQVRRERAAKRASPSDRDCPLHTARDRYEWHAGGTAGDNDVAQRWPPGCRDPPGALPPGQSVPEWQVPAGAATDVNDRAHRRAPRAEPTPVGTAA